MLKIEDTSHQVDEDFSGVPWSDSFNSWWNDQENGCPTLVLDNDEQFARAVWAAAIKSVNCA